MGIIIKQTKGIKVNAEKVPEISPNILPSNNPIIICNIENINIIKYTTKKVIPNHVFSHPANKKFISLFAKPAIETIVNNDSKTHCI